MTAPAQLVPDPEPKLSLSHFVHLLHRYRYTIVLSLAATALAYLIVATGLYLLSGTDRVTVQRFRLDFEGAGAGRYPNSTKFNITDIVSGPILTKVYRDDDLSRFLGFGDFSRSVYVLESNPTFERLVADYEAKMADPRVSPVDRERLQQEFDLKQQSIAKNEYALYFGRRLRGSEIPEPVARKALLDILNGWADFEVNQQRVTSYQIAVLSPEVLTPSDLEKSDLIAAIAVMREKLNRAIADVDAIRRLPGATVVRTPQEHLSLDEVRLRLVEIVRFRLEPLMPVLLRSNLVNDRAATVRFLETQLDFDRRELEARQRDAEAARQALALYEQPTTADLSSATRVERSASPTSAEGVMPQLSEGFLDRLITLTGRSADLQFRQNLTDDYRKAMTATAPLQQAVAYDTQVLADARGAVADGTRLDARQVWQRVEAARSDSRALIATANQLFQLVSTNMSPTAQLMTLSSPPTSVTLRDVSLPRLTLFGVLLILIAIPVIVLACVLHDRLREEEAAEAAIAGEPRPIHAS